MERTESSTARRRLFWLLRSEPAGRVGTAPRTICCGPGISDTDISFIKNIPINERSHFEFRAELFNIFNHTQFYNPDGNSTDGAQFGQVTQVKIRVWPVCIEVLFLA